MMVNVLCIGGPLDGKWHQMDHLQDKMCYKVISSQPCVPMMSNNCLDLYGEEIIMTEHWYQKVAISTDSVSRNHFLLMHESIDFHQAMDKLIRGYKPD